MAQKGKQGTKGAKQIVEDNKSTLAFFRNMALGCGAVSLIVAFTFFEFTKLAVFMYMVSLLTLGCAYKFLAFMSHATYSENGALLDSGNDLNMEGGVAENAKDVIILSSGTMLLALISNYFWLLLLLAPIRAVWMLWGSIIRPWLAQRNINEEPELDEKKQRKMERKMRRMR